MNYEGSAEKFGYRIYFFASFVLVPSVTANLEMTICDIPEDHNPLRERDIRFNRKQANALENQ